MVDHNRSPCPGRNPAQRPESGQASRIQRHHEVGRRRDQGGRDKKILARQKAQRAGHNERVAVERDRCPGPEGVQREPKGDRRAQAVSIRVNVRDQQDALPALGRGANRLDRTLPLLTERIAGHGPRPARPLARWGDREQRQIGEAHRVGHRGVSPIISSSS